MPFQKRLIVNADDFGLHPSINNAVAKAHLEGIVTSASLMAGTQLAPAFEHALNLLPILPTLDIGLHFTLVGAPGLPPDSAAFLKAKFAGEFPAKRIESMLRQQLDTLLGCGVNVSHIDSHQHIHALPSVMRTVASVCIEYGINAVRLPREVNTYDGASVGRVIASKMLAVFAGLSCKELVRAGVRYPEYFSGMAISGHLSPSSMIRLLESCRPGVTEVLCHPGDSNSELGKVYAWGYDWESEMSAVTDGKVRECLDVLEIELATFGSLGYSAS